MSIITIDGSQGEGGGQIIRSSLSLSAVTQQPVKLINIRAGRPKPGLMRQHLTAVQAIAKICDAEVDGAALKSSSLVFKPAPVRAGDYQFEIGTAGSTSLVAQTLLPPLMLADAVSTITLSGGTHNPWCPPFDFLQRAYLPQLAKMNIPVSAQLHRYGFYPAGGGQIQMQIQPSGPLVGLELMNEGMDWHAKVIAIVSQLPKSVARRECAAICKKTGWGENRCQVIEVDDPAGPGNVVMIELASKDVTELVIDHGKPGLKAEKVARSVLRQARSIMTSGVPVGEYLADQLMMPMGLAAAAGQSSQFRTGALSMHSKTHLEILKRFLNIRIAVEPESGGDNVVVKFSG